MELRWVEKLRFKENLGKFLTLTSIVLTLGLILFSSRRESAGEKVVVVQEGKDSEGELLSQKRTRQTFLSEDESDSVERASVREFTAKKKVLRNRQFMSDTELRNFERQPHPVTIFADDQQLDKLHFVVGKSLTNTLDML